MIIGDNREAVIENIKRSAENQDFYAKVELNDPVLTEQQAYEITDKYLKNRNKPLFKFKTFLMRRFVNVATTLINKDTEIIGAEKLPDMKNGVIITSNHFGPLENTVIRHLLKKCGNGKIKVVSQAGNFLMTGPIGLLMNYADTIPISEEPRYLARDFISLLDENLKKGKSVLIYPEQEMWFNYRKPRPLKRGAYLFATKLNVPVVSCFVEIIDIDKIDTEQFFKVKYRLHILDTLYPDKNITTREASELLCKRDYELKKSAYEKIYGKKLDYKFENSDIAGWRYEK